MVHAYTDKMATTLKAKATVSYPVQIVLLNFTKAFRRFLIDRRHTFVGILPVVSSSLTDKEYDFEQECWNDPFKKNYFLFFSMHDENEDIYHLIEDCTRTTRDMKVVYGSLRELKAQSDTLLRNGKRCEARLRQR